MSAKATNSLILKNAELINRLEHEMKKAYENKSADYEEKCQKFHQSYDLLAFPGGLQKELALLKEKDPNAIALAVEYLQANPYFFRSGYIKQSIVRYLKNVPLTEKQIKELQDVIVRACGNAKREFQDYCRLARAFWDQEFEYRIKKLLQETNNEQIKQQVQRLLKVIRS